MARQALAGQLFDAGRLAYVAFFAGLVVIVDVTVLDLVGIQSTLEAITQFLIIVIGSYVGLTIVDVMLNDGEAE